MFKNSTKERERVSERKLEIHLAYIYLFCLISLTRLDKTLSNWMLANSRNSKKRYLSNSQQQVTQGLRKKQKVKVKIENDRKEVKRQTNRTSRRSSRHSFVHVKREQSESAESSPSEESSDSSEDEDEAAGYEAPRSRRTSSRQLATLQASEAKSRPEVKRSRIGAKLHTCVECEYTSAQKGDLTRHMRTHTGVKPFRCDECEFACAQKGHLTAHMRTHTGVKPFRCDECEYASTRKGALTVHMLIHSGVKPFR